METEKKLMIPDTWGRVNEEKYSSESQGKVQGQTDQKVFLKNVGKKYFVSEIIIESQNKD